MRTLLAVSTALGALCISTGLAAAADDYQPMAPVTGGFYASLHAGAYLPSDSTASFRLSGQEPTGNVNADTGYRLGGALGYDFNDNVAAEVELSYVRSDVSSIDVGAPFFVTQPTTGYGSVFTIMGNAVIGNDYGAWRPYVGAGIGAALVSLNVDFASGIDDSDWALAGQVFAGVDYALSDRASIGGRYRYTHIGSTGYTDGNGFPVGLNDFGSHSFEVVLKYRFGK